MQTVDLSKEAMLLLMGAIQDERSWTFHLPPSTISGVIATVETDDRGTDLVCLDYGYGFELSHISSLHLLEEQAGCNYCRQDMQATSVGLTIEEGEL